MTPYVERYIKARERYDTLADLREKRQAKAETIGRFLQTLAQREELLTEFDSRLWLTVVDCATANRDGTVTFRFYDGTEITR